MRRWGPREGNSASSLMPSCFLTCVSAGWMKPQNRTAREDSPAGRWAGFSRCPSTLRSNSVTYTHTTTHRGHSSLCLCLAESPPSSTFLPTPSRSHPAQGHLCIFQIQTIKCRPLWEDSLGTSACVDMIPPPCGPHWVLPCWHG